MGAGEEGVGSALASHGGFRSMPAVHDGRIRERKQLALDALKQRLEVAAGQVGSPDRALEQHVSGERRAVSLEHNAARRVARGVARMPKALACSGTWSYSSRSPGWRYTGAPVSALSRGTPSTWSMWAWVSQIATGFTPASAILWAIRLASSPGSMTAHSPPASSMTR